MTDAELEKTKRDLRIGGYHYRDCATAFNCKCNCGLEEIVLAALQKVSEDGPADKSWDVDKLLASLTAAEAQLAEARKENAKLREELNWQNHRNSGHPTKGGFELYINEEWTGLAHASIDTDQGWSATLSKRRYDPDDERVRVRRVAEDDGILSDLTATRAEVERLRECLQSMLDAYEELHAKYDLGDCEATIAARAAMSNPEKQ